jgi:hypothetical protein
MDFYLEGQAISLGAAGARPLVSAAVHLWSEFRSLRSIGAQRLRIVDFGLRI